jgi:CBS domain-containing protein
MTKKKTLTVGEVMSRVPVTIDQSLTIEDALQRMFDHKIRHLPVTQDGHLVGVISERDLAIMESLPLQDRAHTTVGQTMSGHVFTCPPSESLRVIVDVMAERKLGTVVVMDAGALVGIFTTIDALRVLSAQLESNGAES